MEGMGYSYRGMLVENTDRKMVVKLDGNGVIVIRVRVYAVTVTQSLIL